MTYVYIVLGFIGAASLALNVFLWTSRDGLKEEIAVLAEQADTLAAARSADQRALQAQKLLTEEARIHAMQNNAALDNLEAACPTLSDADVRDALVRLLYQGGTDSGLSSTGSSSPTNDARAAGRAKGE